MSSPGGGELTTKENVENDDPMQGSVQEDEDGEDVGMGHVSDDSSEEEEDDSEEEKEIREDFIVEDEEEEEEEEESRKRRKRRKRDDHRRKLVKSVFTHLIHLVCRDS